MQKNNNNTNQQHVLHLEVCWRDHARLIERVQFIEVTQVRSEDLVLEPWSALVHNQVLNQFVGQKCDNGVELVSNYNKQKEYKKQNHHRHQM